MTEPAVEPRARASYDPFAAPAPTFPRARLLRAGVAAELVENLDERWREQMSAAQRRTMAAFVTRSPDSVIRERYTEPEEGDVAGQLRTKTRAELRDLLRAQGKPLAGKHDELVARLLEDNGTSDDGDGPDDSGDEHVVGEPTDDTDGPQGEVVTGDGTTVTGTLPPESAQGDAAAPAAPENTPETPADAPAPDGGANETPADGAPSAPAGTQTPAGDNAAGQPTSQEQ